MLVYNYLACNNEVFTTVYITRPPNLSFTYILDYYNCKTKHIAKQYSTSIFLTILQIINLQDIAPLLLMVVIVTSIS